MSYNYKELVGGSWYGKLRPLFESKYWEWLLNFMESERIKGNILHDIEDPNFFRHFRETSPEDIKVVFLEKFPNKNYDGLALSESGGLYNHDTQTNIFKEVDRCWDIPVNIQNSNLAKWANQGVFLHVTQSVLSNNLKESIDRHELAWLNFNKYLFELINQKNDVIWVLPGNNVSEFSKYIKNETHKITSVGSPSPQNKTNPFIGSCIFLKVNVELKNLGKDEISWG